MFKRILHTIDTLPAWLVVLAAVVLVVAVVGIVVLIVQASAFFDGMQSMVLCRMGWYDEARTIPHYTNVPDWGDGDPCAHVPPCGDPPVYGAGPPCDSLPTATPP